MRQIKEGMDREDYSRCKICSFPACSLRIGSWQREAKHAPDIMVKCYFRKKLLLWEVLDDDFKRKMQMSCHCVSAIKATYPEGQPSILEIELMEQPLYFCENEPTPRWPTSWARCEDFTGGEAPRFRRHTLSFVEGTLKKLYENLLIGCPELYFSSRRSFSSLNSTFSNNLPQSVLPQQFFNNLHLQQSPLPRRPVMGVIGTNFLPENAIEQFHSAIDPISSQPVKTFGPVDVNIAAMSIMQQSNSSEHLPLSIPQVTKFNYLESNPNEIGQVASTSGGLDWRNNGYSTTPRVFNQTEVQMAQTAGGYSRFSNAPRLYDQKAGKKAQTPEGCNLADGEYTLCDPNMSVSPNDHFSSYRQSYQVRNVFNLVEGDKYSLSNLNTHMAPRNLTNRQVAHPENNILMTNGNEPEVIQ